jgi:hypothetical protein
MKIAKQVLCFAQDYWTAEMETGPLEKVLAPAGRAGTLGYPDKMRDSQVPMALISVR